MTVEEKKRKKTGKAEYLSKTAVKSLAFFSDRHHNINARHCCFRTQGYNETHLDEGNNALLCLAKLEPKISVLHVFVFREINLP